MADETLVTAAEVARLAEVGRAAVSNWRRRYPDFPQPADDSSSNPRFKLSEIEAWLHGQGKLTVLTPAQYLWRALDIGRSDAEMVQLLAGIARYLHDPESASALPESVRSLLDERALHDELGVQSRAELVEQLYARYFERQPRHQLATPDGLAELMAELAACDGVVFDPACGPGNVLRAAATRGASRLVGQEVNESFTELARARLPFHAPSDIATDDALRADAHPGLRADAVLCEPPFGYRDWGHDDLGVDRRWEYGFPVKGEPELAWLQHCLAHARSGGYVVMLLPAGVAARRSGRTIRKALVRRGVVRAVLALPPGLLMSTGIALHLWVLRAPEQDEIEPILLVDASEHQPSHRGRVDWHALHTAVLEPWREFESGADVPAVPGRQCTVDAIDLLDENVDLTPSKHLPIPQSTVDTSELSQAQAALSARLAELAGTLPEVHPAPAQQQPTTTVSELARAGALTTLRQHSGRLELDDAPEFRGPLVLTGRDVATRTEPSMRLLDDPSADLVELRAGDVVIPHIAAGDGRPSTRVIHENGLILGPNLWLIRVDPERMDAEFLAGYLSATRVADASSSTHSGAHRLDVRRVQIPLLDIAEQRNLGEAFQRLRAFTTELREAAEHGTEIASRLTDGLAEGVLRAGDPAE